MSFQQNENSNQATFVCNSCNQLFIPFLYILYSRAKKISLAT